MFAAINELVKDLSSQFEIIDENRKIVLIEISKAIQLKNDKKEPIDLVYICTHNSRRSHFGQVAASIAAATCPISNVNTYSGGTEETAFNQNAIQALESFGMDVIGDGRDSNPTYFVFFGDNQFSICFSKKYNHPANPKSNYIAIMTCSDADDNCPIISGSSHRFSTPYTDPKESDNTPYSSETYKNRFKQILLETLFVFSYLKQRH
jgi:protein-tyrosine phosphatase/arsenate reductase